MAEFNASGCPYRACAAGARPGPTVYQRRMRSRNSGGARPEAHGQPKGGGCMVTDGKNYRYRGVANAISPQVIFSNIDVGLTIFHLFLL